MRKCLLTIYIFLLFIFFISSHVVLSEDKQEINIESDYVIKKYSYDKAGTSVQETWLNGVRLLTIIMKNDKIIQRVYHINDYSLIEHDEDGDGIFENITIVKDLNELFSSFRRHSNGNIVPLPIKEINKLKTDLKEAYSVTNTLIDTVSKDKE